MPVQQIRSQLPRVGTAVVLVALLGATGCDLFAPREPEEPNTVGSNFQPPTTPSVVLENLRSSIESANALDYRKCFSDSSLGVPDFRFQPSAQGESVAPGRFATWDLDDEEQYIRTIFSELSNGSIASLILTPSDVTEPPVGDSIRFSADYQVSFPHTREGVEREATGRLNFTMRLSPSRNEWYISYWQDIADGDNPSWSLIKARFSD